MELEDLYEHNNPNLIYITENIPTTETEDKFSEEFTNGCKCEEQCRIENKCECLLKSGVHYKFPKVVMDRSSCNLYTIKLLDINKPIYECNTNCCCYGKYCGNRLVQFGPRLNLKIITCDKLLKNNRMKLNNKPPEEKLVMPNKKFKLNENINRQPKNKGLGLITSENIQKGNFLCEYAGEIITKQEAIKRHKINEQNSLMNYIFCINEHFGEKMLDTYIDPSKFGNIGRYINHSCQPNCELIPIRVNNTIPKLCIFAVQDIEKNTELTFDYGTENLKLKNTDSSLKRIECLCETVNCRKYIPFSNYET